MNHFLLVHLLNPFDHLLSYQAAGLDVELFLALIEELIETWTKHVHHHDVKLVFLIGLIRANVIQLWNVSFPTKLMNEF